MTLSKSLTKYDKLNNEDKQRLLIEAYIDQQMSFGEIAKLAGTYPNKIRRDAKKLGVPARSRSEAQSLALSEGRHKHPTKGTKRSESTKIAISERMAASWDMIDDEERERRSEMARDQWEAKTEDEKKELHKAAGDAVRRAAKEGSKLEKYLLQELIAAGYRVDYHREHVIVDERLHIDMFIKSLNVAIEVDGPSHFSPIWGHETLQRNQKADIRKNGLIMGRGICIIRVQQKKSLSQKYQRDLRDELLAALNKIETKFPPRNQRHILIGE